MKEAYVSNASITFTDANKTNAAEIIDVSDGSRVRIFSISWMPADGSSVLTSQDSSSSITVYSGDPSASGTQIYKHKIEHNKYTGGNAQFQVMPFYKIPIHGILAENVTGGIYVQGSDRGICFASITYQVG